MELHHLGYACSNIEEALTHVKALHDVKHISDILFDELQNAHVCLIDINNGPRIELVSGQAVQGLVEKNIRQYHICYEVDDLFQSIELHKSNGAVEVSEPKPAKLFDGRLVTFLQTDLGLIELLEKTKTVKTKEITEIYAHKRSLKKIMIASTFATQFLQAGLTHLITELHLNLEVDVAPYNQVFQLLLDSSSVLNNNHQGFNLILIRFEDWLHNKNNTDEIDYDQIKRNVNDLLIALSKASSTASHILCLCPPSPNLSSTTNSFFKKIENEMLSEIKNMPGIYFITDEEINKKYQVNHYFDQSMNELGHIPYTSEFEAALGLTVARKIHSIIRTPYKVIVLDCDQTLWDGICGEVGAANVKVTPGKLALQKYLSQLKEDGFLLCVCSKNQEADVLSVFDINNEMHLKKDHITQWCINWNAKSQNIKYLSQKLNLALDSFVLIDDNPIECAEVRTNCPDVLVLELPADDKIDHFIQHIWAFDKPTINHHDTIRTLLYKQNAERKNTEKSFSSFKEFINSLNLEIKITFLEDHQIPRVSDLTYRTNQFNTTMIRRTESEVSQLSLKDLHCLVTTVSDRFGDYGLVGVAIFSLKNKALIVDSLMLSCRALGRGVEHKIIAKLGEIARKNDAKTIQINFNLSEKNQPALDFLEKAPFVKDKNGSFILTANKAADIIYSPENNNIASVEIKTDPEISTQQNSNAILLHIANQFSETKNLLDIIKNKKWRKTNKKLTPFKKTTSLLSDETESLLKNILQEILACTSIEVTDDFFDLGMDSLSTIQLISKVSQQLDVSLSVRDIFDNRTIAKLSQLITMPSVDIDSMPALTPRLNRFSPVQASSNQQRLWFLDQLEGTAWHYNMPIAYSLKGDLNIHALKSAFMTLIERHESLRTTFENKEGVPYQTINDNFLFSLEVEDIQFLNEDIVQEMIKAEAKQHFDLSSGPLFKVRLLKRNNHDYILLITKHHIIFDGWSYGIMNKELTHLYNAYKDEKSNPLPDLTLEYSDFSVWQQQWLQSSVIENQLNYWEKRLANLKTLQLPTDYPPSQQKTYQGKYIPIRLTKESLQILNQIASQQKVTLFTLLLSLFSIVIANYCGEYEIPIGVPEIGRRNKDVDALIGFFINTLVLRINLSPSQTFLQIAKEVQELIIEAQSHQDVPLEKIIERLGIKRSIGQNPLFQILFTYQNFESSKLALSDIEIEPLYTGYDAARLDITLELINSNNLLEGGIYYNADLFNKETIISLISNFQALLAQVCLDPNISVFSSPALSAQTFINSEVTLLDLFHKQVKCQPDKIAVQYNEYTLTFSELNSRANQLAHYLYNKKLPNKIIAITVDRSLELVISILACFKAGYAYVPLDPEYPEDRIKLILEDTKASAVITKTEFLDKFIDFKSPIIDLNEDGGEISTNSCHDLEIIINNNDLAYVIYTSGTTGTPKGVMVSHQNLNDLIFSTKDLYQFNSEDTIALFHSYTFDVSVWEMWTALCYGARSFILSHATIHSAAELYHFISHEKITVLNLTPSVFNQLIIYESILSKVKQFNLRLIILAGEALKPRELLPWFKNHSDDFTKIYNMYGITETTVYSSYARVTEGAAKTNRSIIGKPIPGVQMYVLDNELNLVPPNVTGEIYIGGHGLTSGYLNKPELTQEKFIKNPLAGMPQEKIYKTGDLARYLDDGTIEYLGRIDNQLKLRGYRIELDEIESTLLQHDAVHSVKVRPSTANSDTAQLIAYVIPNQQTALPVAQFIALQKDLENKKLHTLPNGMLISHLNKSETDLLYEEIFVNQEYYKNGIVIKKGDIVFDVGANIGMFSLFMLQTFQHIKLYAFEPIPPIFDVLNINAKLYGSLIQCFNLGFSSENKTEIFNYYANASVLSSRLANIHEESTLLKSFLLERYKVELSALSDEEINKLIEDRLSSVEIPCQLKTLSSFIADNAIDKIDLLKIDVEKSELEVLAGIYTQDWAKIKQIIIEVHDNDGALDKILSLLKAAHYSVVVEKDSFLNGTNLFVVYASQNNQQFDTINEETTEPLYKWNNPSALEQDIHQFLKKKLPNYMVPSHIMFLNHFPVTLNGKLDVGSLPKIDSYNTSIKLNVDTNDKTKKRIAEIWEDVLKITLPDHHINFFEIGGNSLLLMQVHSKLISAFPHIILTVTDLFNYPTIEKLTAYINKEKHLDNAHKFVSTNHLDSNENAIAVIGMAAKFPEANNVEEFWDNIKNGKDSIQHFLDSELLNAGVDPKLLEKENFIRACGIIEDIDKFDAPFFGYSPEEASLIDPQQRQFLEAAWCALEISGYAPSKYSGEIGIFAGMGDNDYQHRLILAKNDNHDEKNELLIQLANEKDYLATRVAYKLGLNGAAININTACSTSLVAVVKACQSLLLHETDIALAGGISLIMPYKYGYLYERNGIYSSDARCRSFDHKSSGTVPSSGMGIVVLKRLSDALKDGDNIEAVITGYAINNDGNNKVSFTAPSVSGQSNCIRKSQKIAGIDPAKISYIETHGSGTTLGDPIEIKALTDAFHQETDQKQFCAIGSIKTNIGHAQTAAGIAGLIKTILMLKHREIPPSLHYESPNAQIDFANTPFYVNTKLTKWKSNQKSLVAAVNSFGLGGTNAHVILESAPKPITTPKLIAAPNINSVMPAKAGMTELKTSSTYKLLVLSAKSADALKKQAENLRIFLQDKLNKNKIYDSYLDDVAYTLQVGRTDFEYRRAWICLDIHDAIKKLSIDDQDIVIDLAQEKNITEFELYAIAKRWIEHQHVNWISINKDKHQRVPLPTYPFAAKRYWAKSMPSYKMQDDIAKEEADISSHDTSDRLIHLLKELLGYSTLKETDNFFELGGDSLTGLIALLKIENEFGVKINLNDFLSAKNLKGISKLIAEPASHKSHESRIIKLKSGNHDNPIFIIHPGNGTLFHYKPLISCLNTNETIFGIENTLSNDIVNNFLSIENMAAHYINLIKTIQPKGPYTLCGWSFGGVVAFEMAKQLEDDNTEVAKIFLYDSWAKWTPRFNDLQFFNQIYAHDFEDLRDDKNGVQWENLLWQRINLLLNYKPKKIMSDIVLFKASNLNEEYQDIDDSTNHWGKLTTGSTHVVYIPGNHTSIMQSPNIEKIASVQQDIINASDHLLSNEIISA